MQGTTVTDYLPMERERGITIVSAAISFDWRNHRINLVDTPGHVDFTVEVERSVRVLDGAVTILDAVHGVQAQTETVWKQANRYKVPRIAFFNKYDREGASWQRTADMMRERLQTKPLMLQLPLGEGFGFRGVIDVLRLELIEWVNAAGSAFRAQPLDREKYPSEWKEAVSARARAFETLGEVDDIFLEAYFSATSSGGNNDEATLFQGDLAVVHAAIRRACISLKVVPCFVGASFRNKGVQPLMDAIAMYLPSPLDVPHFQKARVVGRNEDEEEVTLYPDDKKDMVALAWKVVHHQQMGLITYFRVMSGALLAGKMLVTTNGPRIGPKERPIKVAMLRANEMDQVPRVTAGNIGAIVGLKNVSTGDTLMGADSKQFVVLQGLHIPPAVFFRSIEPYSLAEQEKLDSCLALLQREDPSFVVRQEPETGQTLVGGMGELHLEYLLDRLFKHYGVNGEVGPIMIAYRTAAREAVELTQEAEHHHDAPSGKRTHGWVKARIESRDLDDAGAYERVEDGVSVVWNSIGRVTTEQKRTVEAFREGVVAACMRGALKGFPLVNIDVELLEWRSEDESGTAVKVCAEKLIREFCSQTRLAVLEPTMAVEIRSEAESFGGVIADITSARRGEVLEVEVEGLEKVAKAVVPLKEMIGYSRHFRSLTAGKGSFEMHFKNFAPLSEAQQSLILGNITTF